MVISLSLDMEQMLSSSSLQVQVGAEDYIHVKIFEFLKHERKAPILVDVEPLNLKI